MNYNLIFDLALIIIVCKSLSILMKKIAVPQVVGLIIAGLLIGPNVLGFVDKSPELTFLAEIGVLLLMFSAGLETDLKEIKNTGLVSLLVAALGVIVPLGGGFLLYSVFYGFGNFGSSKFLSAIFVGTIMTATSVGITVEVLKEMGKLKSKVGTIILSAAIIDDVIGIVILAFVSGLKDTSINPTIVLGKTLAFFVFAILAGFIIHKIFVWLEKYWDHHIRVPIFALGICLIYSWAAEALFGIADITGAFMAGVIISTVKPASEYTDTKININSYMFFTPVFFASIGIKITIGLENITGKVLIFSLLFAVVAMACKLVGCFSAARLSRFNCRDSLKIGAGMMARGEVALIVATKGMEAGVFDPLLFTAVITLIILSSISTPIILKALYKENKICK